MTTLKDSVFVFRKSVVDTGQNPDETGIVRARHGLETRVPITGVDGKQLVIRGYVADAAALFEPVRAPVVTAPRLTVISGQSISGQLSATAQGGTIDAAGFRLVDRDGAAISAPTGLTFNANGSFTFNTALVSPYDSISGVDMRNYVFYVTAQTNATPPVVSPVKAVVIEVTGVVDPPVVNAVGPFAATRENEGIVEGSDPEEPVYFPITLSFSEPGRPINPASLTIANVSPASAVIVTPPEEDNQPFGVIYLDLSTVTGLAVNAVQAVTFDVTISDNDGTNPLTSLPVTITVNVTEAGAPPQAASYTLATNYDGSADAIVAGQIAAGGKPLLLNPLETSFDPATSAISANGSATVKSLRTPGNLSAAPDVDPALIASVIASAVVRRNPGDATAWQAVVPPTAAITSYFQAVPQDSIVNVEIPFRLTDPDGNTGDGVVTVRLLNKVATVSPLAVETPQALAFDSDAAGASDSIDARQFFSGFEPGTFVRVSDGTYDSITVNADGTATWPRAGVLADAAFTALAAGGTLTDSVTIRVQEAGNPATTADVVINRTVTKVAVAPPPPSGLAEPNTADGKAIVQNGPWFLYGYTGAEPVLNMMLLAGSPSVNGLSGEQEEAFYWSKQDVPGFPGTKVYDAENHILNGDAAGNDWTLTLAFQTLSNSDDVNYRGLEGEWGVVWEGGATISATQHPSEKITTVGPNRIEVVVGPGDNSVRFVASGITPATPLDLKRVRLYRKKFEDKVNAGETWHPDFKRWQSRFKITRFMDILLTNSLWATTAAQVAHPVEGLPWTAPLNKTASGNPYTGEDFWNVRGSAPLRKMFDLCTEIGNAAWINMPPLMGAPDVRYNDDGTPVDGFTANGLNARFEARIESILASDEQDKWCDAMVAAMIAAGYPENRTVYLEIGNEPWNSGAAFATGYRYFWGVTGGLINLGIDIGGSNAAEHMRGYGYMFARMADKMKRALARAGRSQRIRFCLNTQTTSDSRTRHALDGVQGYVNHMSPPGWAWSDIEIVNTDYLAGGFKYFTGQQLFPAAEALGTSSERKAAFVAAWTAAYNADPDALAQRLEDYLAGTGEFNGQSLPRNVEWHIDRINALKAVGDTYGSPGDRPRVGTAYEGGTHDDVMSELRGLPGITDYVRDFFAGPRNGRILKSLIAKREAAHPGGVIALYGVKGLFGLGNPWNWKQEYEYEGLGAEDELYPVLRAPLNFDGQTEPAS